MAKRWLARVREKSIPVLRRSFIVSGFLVTVVIVVGAVYLAKPFLWPGGVGIEKGETVTNESVEKDAKGKVVKSIKTTKYDDGKTLWDWSSLLGVPLSLAILGFGLQLSQQKRAEVVAKVQREIAADETKEEVLQVYFDRLSALLVDKNLLAIASKVYATETQENEGQLKIEATPEERELLHSAVDVIRARTLSILRRFENDAERKTSVIRFLIEADIVSKLKLSLSDANLSRANLSRANLNGASLIDVNLIGADLIGANLIGASLIDANLIGADLIGANLIGANLIGADLIGADLSHAYLIGARFIGANLNDANLFGAYLSGATLSGADLSDANLNGADLSDANLFGADLSDTNLFGADLSDANLNGANLNGANLFGARFINNLGLSNTDKADMKARGAIFEDSP